MMTPGLSGREAAGRRRTGPWAIAAVAVLLAWGFQAGALAAEEPVARAVLFFSPSCGHCEYVINDVLPGLFEEAGGAPETYFDETLQAGRVAFYLLANGRLEMLLVDVSVHEGVELFYAATDAFSIPSGGVPRLIVGDRYLIGSRDIPEQFPGIVLGALASGEGIDWPAIPGLAEAVDSVPTSGGGSETTTATVPASTTTVPAVTTSTPDPPGTSVPETSTSLPEVTTTSAPPGEDGGGGTILPPGTGEDSVAGRFGRDPVGTSISVVVLVLMLGSLGGVAWWIPRPGDRRAANAGVVVLALIGLGVASYLGFVEVGGSEAVCGPVGDCNTVQQSEYARLFGVIPLGLVGVAGYTVVLGTWAAGRWGRGRGADFALVALFAGTVGGVLLSVYLTFLEPFVIGATCAWCLASAVIITGLMWLTARPAARAWERLQQGGTRKAVKAGSRARPTAGRSSKRHK